MTKTSHKISCIYFSALIRGFISVISILLFLTASSHADDPINIGLTLGLSGKYKKVSDYQKNGFVLWGKDVNNRGGMLGRKVKLLIYDDKSDPEVARRIYERMINTEKVDFVFAPFSSVITEAILPVTEQYGYSVLASGAAADRLWHKGYTHVFGLFTPASKIPVSFLEMIALNNIRKVAIVFTDNTFSADIASGSKKWAERFGLEVVLYEKLNDGLDNIQEMMIKAKNAGSEALLLGGHFNDSVAMRKALLNIDWYPKAFYVPLGPGLPAFFKELNAATEFVFSSSQWEMLGGFEYPGAEKFINSYENEYKIEPIYFAATAYAAGQILEEAVNKAGDVDRQKIRDTLSSLSTMSIIGRYGVSRRGMQIRNFTMVVQVQNGTRVVVWPLKLKQADPIFK